MQSSCFSVTMSPKKDMSMGGKGKGRGRGRREKHEILDFHPKPITQGVCDEKKKQRSSEFIPHTAFCTTISGASHVSSLPLHLNLHLYLLYLSLIFFIRLFWSVWPRARGAEEPCPKKWPLPFPFTHTHISKCLNLNAHDSALPVHFPFPSCSCALVYSMNSSCIWALGALSNF